MADGKVKWFDNKKRFGFIQPNSGGGDVFVHMSAVEEAGLTTLSEGQSVSYEEKLDRNKVSAVNLKVED
ncbi:cold-shock protein [Rickettsiales bacterium LUAb2]